MMYLRQHRSVKTVLIGWCQQASRPYQAKCRKPCESLEFLRLHNPVIDGARCVKINIDPVFPTTFNRKTVFLLNFLCFIHHFQKARMSFFPKFMETRPMNVPTGGIFSHAQMIFQHFNPMKITIFQCPLLQLGHCPSLPPANLVGLVGVVEDRLKQV